MQKARNFKFLNKSPMILGFEFFDCVWAVVLSMFIFALSSSHFTSLAVGFLFVVMKSLYKKLYPQNTVFFWKNRKDGVATMIFFKRGGRR